MSQFDFKQIIAMALAAELAKKIVAGAFLASGAVVTWFVSIGSWSTGTLIWSIAVSGGFGAGLVTLLLSQRRSIYRCRYPGVAFQIEVLEKSCSYVINDKDELIYRKRMKFKALRDQIDEYIGSYLWTGGGSPTPLPGDGAQEVTKVARAGVRVYYRIFFGRALRRGDIHEVEVIWPPLTNWRDSSPFVSLNVREPTRKLVFDVKLPAGEVGPMALAESMAGDDAIYPFKTEDVELDHGRCIWEVTKPSLYAKYRLQWTWRPADCAPPLSEISAPGA